MSGDSALHPRDQPLLSLLAAAAVGLMLPVLVLAGGPTLLTLLGVILAAGLVGAGRDALHAMAALGIVAILWLASDADPESPLSLALAALMLSAHSVVALRSSIPPGAELLRPLVLPWLRRGLVALGVTVVVYAAGLAVHQLDLQGSTAVVVVALVLLSGLALTLTRATAGEDRS